MVLQASGHVERFTDLMVTDLLTGDCHRADHLLEHSLEAILEDPKKPPSADEKKASSISFYKGRIIICVQSWENPSLKAKCLSMLW